VAVAQECAHGIKGRKSVTVDQAIVDELTLANRPRQLRLLENAAGVLIRSDAITELSVRGSIAAGTADRLSDIDFVVGVQDNAFPTFAHILDALVATELAAICPGWRDTIVHDMGGLGYVYLIVFDGHLYQLDLYLVPSSRVSDVRNRTRARVLFNRRDCLTPESMEPEDLFIRQTLDRSRSCADLFAECLVLVQMILKRIRRGQIFLVYSDTCLLMSAIKDILKTALAADSASWGWYHLDETVGRTSLGQACLAELAELIALPTIRTQEQLNLVFERILMLMRRIAPNTLQSFDTTVDAFKHYLGFA
jgi:predicted nucleotidyltransferase